MNLLFTTTLLLFNQGSEPTTAPVDPGRSAMPQATAEGAKTAAPSVTSLDDRIWCIHEALNGDMWFGSNGAGAYRYADGVLTHFTAASGLAGVHVRDIAEDKEGRVFVSTNTAVCLFDGERFQPLEIHDAPTASEGWVLDPDDVWIVFDPGTGGPCRYDGTKLYRLKLPRSPAEGDFRKDYVGTGFEPEGLYSIHRDRRGHVWFGTAGAGLCRFDGTSIRWMYEESITTTPSGGGFGIRSIFEDRQGDFWVCTTRQRFKIGPEGEAEQRSDFLDYTTKVGVPDAAEDEAPNFNFFAAIAEDSNGTLWMACASGGVMRYDGKEAKMFPVGEDAYAYEIHCDRSDRLWVGTLEQGAYTLTEEEGARRFMGR